MAKCIHISTSVDVLPHGNSPALPDSSNSSGSPNGSRVESGNVTGSDCRIGRSDGQEVAESGNDAPPTGPIFPFESVPGPDACPQCRGRGLSDPLPDFEGDDPKTMRVCTMSYCPLCHGTGRDPNYRVVRNAESAMDSAVPGSVAASERDELGGEVSKQMVTQKTWKEFRDAGLLWWVNRILHTFGWAIVAQVEEDGSVSCAYPARVRFRGFDEGPESDGFVKLTRHISENIRELEEEAAEE